MPPLPENLSICINCKHPRSEHIRGVGRCDVMWPPDIQDGEWTKPDRCGCEKYTAPPKAPTEGFKLRVPENADIVVNGTKYTPSRKKNEE